jgi:hypothetical protein
MPKAMRLVLLCVVAGAIFVSQPQDAGAVAMTPGSYVVSMKWERNNTVFVRLAMYSFRPDFTFRADYWEWNSDQVDTVLRLQAVGIGGPHSTDSTSRVLGAKRFVANSSPTVRFGTWAPWKGTNLKITWSDGYAEWWKRTWHDATLNKIELAYIGYGTSPKSTHMFFNERVGRFVRRDNAPHIGYGFGGATPGFTFAQPMSAFSTRQFQGYALMWNRYCIDYPHKCDGSSNPSQYFDHLTDFSAMTVTTTNILRLFDDDERAGDYCDFPDSYYYTAIPPGSTGMTSRRVLSQSAHDFCTETDTDGSGNIEDEYGHLQNNLQIIDSNYVMRGLVTVETSFEPPGFPDNRMMMMGAMFAIDDFSAAAQSEIEDPYNW